MVHGGDKPSDRPYRDGDFFIACFSAKSIARTRSYQNEELVLAIEELRLRPANRIWLIPVLLSECKVPDRDIGGVRRWISIQWAALYQNWDEGIGRILKAIGVERAVKQQVPAVRTEDPRLAATKVEPVQPRVKQQAPSLPTDALSVAKVVQVQPLVGNPVTIDKPIRLELIRIPAGRFLMSDDERSFDLNVAEFYIGKYPITNAQYATFVQARAP